MYGPALRKLIRKVYPRKHVVVPQHCLGAALGITTTELPCALMPTAHRFAG